MRHDERGSRNQGVLLPENRSDAVGDDVRIMKVGDAYRDRWRAGV
jgi:hypothetical protein